MSKDLIRIPGEVLDGLEAVRVSGKTNMLDWQRVIELAMEMGYDETAFWVYENKGLYSHGVFRGFVATDEKCDTDADHGAADQ